MSRYTGPRVKILRRFGIALPGLTRKTIAEGANPPGEHGAGHRRKASEYREHLDEKQKVRLNYGLSERQFVIYMKAAISSKLDTGLRLCQLLESRLDNVVFRAGYAPTIPAARQIVNHGHILVNGRKVDIASFQVRQGDVISLRERSKKIVAIQESFATPSLARPSYLEVDAEKQTAKMINLPAIEDVPITDLKTNLIIEFYSRKV
ncbi:MAG: 30S ribosomal protein S4 [Proteobacteria bacterium]|jgi:small subunit ribosomal protein S4|nr:30S ribosomal protein S4 [Pseudomonadota bacterium]